MKLKKLFLGLALCLTAGSSHVVLAEDTFNHSSDKALSNQLEVAYKTFYSHTRKLSGDDIKALRFAFGFTNIHADNDLCHINKAYIHTPKVDIPLTVTPEQRFSIPTEKALRLADAKVVLELMEQPNHCDINVQIETLPEYLNNRYTASELQFILGQYMAFFDEMGGFMAFMMPQVSGLQVRFADDNLSAPLTDELSIVKGILRLSTSQIKGLKELSLPVAPMRITALTETK